MSDSEDKQTNELRDIGSSDEESENIKDTEDIKKDNVGCGSDDERETKIEKEVPKSPTKSPKKKEKVKEEEEEEESDEEPRLGLLEQPVVIESGKRQKKKVERLDISGSAGKEKKKLEIKEGSGEKLGDCPRVEFQIQKNKADDLKTLHRLLFTHAGSANVVKKNIRQFSGFTFEKSDKEYEKKVALLNKCTMPMLKFMCDILDIEKKGGKEEVVEKLMDFCMKPQNSGKKLPKPKRKRSSTGKTSEKKKKKSKETKKKKEKKKTPKKKKGSDDDSDEDEDEEEERSEEEEEEGSDKEEEEDKSDVEEDEEDSEDEEAPPKKKARKEQVKKSPPKEKKKRTPKKEAAKPKSKKKKVVSESESEVVDSDSSDDEEPLVKKKKEEPPTNEELKKQIKKILDKADLAELTMKSVLKEIYGMHPAFDLSDRKDFIKKTVKQLIT